ncbi:MAG: hypothetical protein AABX03_05385 [Nanoarchaeota archaeon]
MNNLYRTVISGFLILNVGCETTSYLDDKIGETIDKRGKHWTERGFPIKDREHGYSNHSDKKSEN